MFIVSDVAKSDINEIYEYSILEFGLDTTVKYLMEMEEIFETISSNHSLGTLRNHISEGLYAFPYKSHMVFYRVHSQDTVVIVRVIHGSKDIPNQFIK